jgi:hypothetical protein
MYNSHPIQPQLGSPDPKGQLGGSRQTEAKQNVENSEGSPGDAEDNVKSELGEANDPLGPPGGVRSTGSRKEVERNDDFDADIESDSTSIGSDNTPNMVRPAVNSEVDKRTSEPVKKFADTHSEANVSFFMSYGEHNFVQGLDCLLCLELGPISILRF